MILYLDTSALLKLYIQEEGSERVVDLVQHADFVATCRIAYAEARSAIARRTRHGDLSEEMHQRLVKGLDEEWSLFVVLDFDEKHAGALAARHLLRGFDAIHLSAASHLLSQKDPPDLWFCSFDEKLNVAAAAEGCVLG